MVDIRLLQIVNQTQKKIEDAKAHLYPSDRTYYNFAILDALDALDAIMGKPEERE